MGVSFDTLGIEVPVIPVVVIEDVGHAVDLSAALLAGGLNIIEVTLRTARALDAVSTIKAALPDMVVGAGTVNTAEQIRESVSAGADFLVSPGMTDALLQSAGDCGIPWLPGASTPSEVMRLCDAGYLFQKFFPAEASGGVGKLRAIHAPFPQVRFCPTGGITPGNAGDYLALPNVTCVGGTWLATPNMIREGRWDKIEEIARRASVLG